MSPATILLLMIFFTGLLLGSWGTFVFVFWRSSKVVVHLSPNADKK